MKSKSYPIPSLTLILTLWSVSCSIAWPTSSSSVPSTRMKATAGSVRPSTTLASTTNESSPSSRSSSPSSSTVAMSTTSIQNFRRSACIKNIYRCASPDILGEKLMSKRNDDDDGKLITGNDRFVFEEVGLVLDLRSPSERQEFQSQMWTKQANMKIFETDEVYTPTNRRCVVRIDVLSPPRFMTYIEENWLTPAERAQATWYKIVDGRKLHDLRIERLNERGLAGLNEAILETGKVELLRALQTITQHLEENPDQKAIIHCVQGKDRTGMLVMLIQSILGVPDGVIVADYFQSNQGLPTNEGSAATKEIRSTGRLDRNIFSGTNPEAMLATLQHLRQKYGSVCPGYLDHIGFSESWRQRLRAVVIPDLSPPRSGL